MTEIEKDISFVIDCQQNFGCFSYFLVFLARKRIGLFSRLQMRSYYNERRLWHQEESARHCLKLFAVEVSFQSAKTTVVNFSTPFRAFLRVRLVHIEKVHLSLT